MNNIFAILGNFLFLILGTFVVIGGLVQITFPLASIYYLFIKKAIPRNKILKRLLEFSFGSDCASYSFEEIAKWKSTLKLLSVILSILLGIVFVLVGIFILFPKTLVCFINRSNPF